MVFSLFMIGLLQMAADENLYACGASPQAQELALLIIAHDEQQRESLHCNELLSAAAADRARDLAENPQAKDVTPNEHVREAGFRFPVFYPPTGNQVQANAHDMESPESAVEYLVDRHEHRDLILGDGEFFSRQSEMGVGFHRDSEGRGHYVVFIVEPYAKPKIVIKQEFTEPKVILDEDCGRAWRSSKNAEFRRICRERWLRKKEETQ